MSRLADSSLQSIGALLDALPDAVAVIDAEGHVVKANRAAERLLGFPADGLSGVALEVLLPARYPRATVERRIRALAGHAPGQLGSHMELHLRHRDGHEVAVEVTVSLAEIDGAGVVMATVREIADRERAEAVQRLAAVVDSSSDAIITKDLRAIITTWNRGAERMYGYTADEAIGQPVTILMDAECASRQLPEIMATVRRGESIENLETLRVAKDGHILDVSISISPLRDPRGRVVGAATVARDISERKRADERVRALLESAPDAVVVVGEHGRMVLVNRQTEELFGYSREQLLGHDVEMLIPERLREVEAHRVGYFADPETRLTGAAMELCGLRSDGTEFPIEITFSPLRTDEGVLVYTAIRDISERKVTDEELRRSNHDLEQFAYVASHDLSEPLRVIAGFVDLLAERYRGRLDADADRFIGFIVSGVERMQALIDDILAYSRAGRAEFRPQEVDVAALVREVVEMLAPELTARGGRVEIGELPTVRGEKALLRQIFQNLIGNALKFCDAPAPLIEIRGVRHGRGWRFEVQDNGPGIEPHHAERIFEMFQRLHGRDVAGSGIGLAIVKRLVERHGGVVGVTPAPTRGSIFSFTIPDSPRD